MLRFTFSSLDNKKVAIVLREFDFPNTINYVYLFDSETKKVIPKFKLYGFIANVSWFHNKAILLTDTLNLINLPYIQQLPNYNTYVTDNHLNLVYDYLNTNTGLKKILYIPLSPGIFFDFGIFGYFFHALITSLSFTIGLFLYSQKDIRYLFALIPSALFTNNDSLDISCGNSYNMVSGFSTNSLAWKLFLFKFQNFQDGSIASPEEIDNLYFPGSHFAPGCKLMHKNVLKFLGMSNEELKQIYPEVIVSCTLDCNDKNNQRFILIFSFIVDSGNLIFLVNIKLIYKIKMLKDMDVSYTTISSSINSINAFVDILYDEKLNCIFLCGIGCFSNFLLKVSHERIDFFRMDLKRVGDYSSHSFGLLYYRGYFLQSLSHYSNNEILSFYTNASVSTFHYEIDFVNNIYGIILNKMVEYIPNEKLVYKNQVNANLIFEIERIPLSIESVKISKKYYLLDINLFGKLSFSLSNLLLNNDLLKPNIFNEQPCIFNIAYFPSDYFIANDYFIADEFKSLNLELDKKQILFLRTI